ncbi:MAG: acetyl-CoA carboxylase biotin carboxyl carrier protein [Vulcanimicrobiaceae bacterium]
MDERQTLDELLAIMHEHDLDRLKVKVGDAYYELVRREAGAPVSYMAPPSAAPSAAGAPGMAAPANVKKVTAPLTGVFYRSPSSDAEPFVTEGSHVESGALLCILEAMKLFNEIQSEFAGTVVRIVPENGQLVSQGDELFWIGP